MGLRSALGLIQAGSTAAAGPRPLIPARMLTRFQPDTVLERLTFEDWFGLDAGVSRSVAMTVPAVHRCRSLICGTIAPLPLRAYRGPDQLPDAEQPAWTYRSDGYVSPLHRMLWTLDDVLFTGWSLWLVERGADGFVLVADRCPRELWTFDSDYRVTIGGQPVDDDVALLIPGPDEGLLTTASGTIRTAARLERAAARHASNPVPSIELHQEVDVALTEPEIDAMIDKWTAARDSDTGGVAYTSFGVRANVLGQADAQLLIEGRNAAAVDIARHAGLPAAMLDATTAGASLTYETTTGRNQQFIDYALTLYTAPIAARLSQDDVVPRGQRVAFDTGTLTSPTPAPSGPITLD